LADVVLIAAKKNGIRLGFPLPLRLYAFAGGPFDLQVLFTGVVIIQIKRCHFLAAEPTAFGSVRPSLERRPDRNGAVVFVGRCRSFMEEASS